MDIKIKQILSGILVFIIFSIMQAGEHIDFFDNVPDIWVVILNLIRFYLALFIVNTFVFNVDNKTSYIALFSLSILWALYLSINHDKWAYSIALSLVSQVSAGILFYTIKLNRVKETE